MLGLRDQLGRIAPGQLADLALVRRDLASTLAVEQDAAAFLQHASPQAVESVMVDGAWVMRDRRILAFDEDEVLAEAAAAAAEIRTRIGDGLERLDAALPALTARLAEIVAA